MILEEEKKEEIEIKQMLPDKQAEFRKGRSIVDNLYVLNYTIERQVTQVRGKDYVKFVDMNKELDR